MLQHNIKQDKFIVDLNGFDGPLELLLSLAQKQKVDLKEISIRELVDQYLSFVKNASKLKLELAAEYLLMASFLTYLKSRILLPKDCFEDELTASEIEKNLAYKLKRLSEIKNCTDELFLKPKLGIDFFKRGFHENNDKKVIKKLDASLIEILRAYAKVNSKKVFAPLKFIRESIYKIDEALKSITLSAAQIIGIGEVAGSLEKGKDATLFISDGDPLEIRTNILEAYIQGRKIDMGDKHKSLYFKYQQKYRQLGILKED